MTDDPERRIRDALHGLPLPTAPEALRAELERLPANGAVAAKRGAWAWLLGVGVATVIVAVGAIWVPAHLSGPAATAATHDPSSPASSTPLPAGLIPWTDAGPTPIPSPTPMVVPPGTKKCAPTDLTTSVGWQGATGQMVGRISVTNSSSTGCLLAGPPRKVQLLAGATILATTYTANAGTDPGAPQSSVQPAYLKPGDQAGALIAWGNWCDGARAGVTSVLVTLPDGGQPIRAGATSPGPGIAGSPRCDFVSRGSPISAWAFETIPPEQATPEPLVATVSLSTPPTAKAGQVLGFTVTLTNKGTLPASLDPCPAYTEDLIVGGSALKPPGAQGHLLNCAAIGPQIAAGASVLLAMQYAIPTDIGPGPVELRWSMDPGGPFDSLSASAHATLTLE